MLNKKTKKTFETFIETFATIIYINKRIDGFVKHIE